MQLTFLVIGLFVAHARLHSIPQPMDAILHVDEAFSSNAGQQPRKYTFPTLPITQNLCYEIGISGIGLYNTNLTMKVCDWEKRRREGEKERRREGEKERKREGEKERSG